MNIGFIGCGNMATAMIRGMTSSGLVKKGAVVASDVCKSTLAKVQNELGIATTQDNKQVVKQSNIVVLAVKPHYYAPVIEEIRPVASPDTVFISIAPGHTLADLEELFQKREFEAQHGLSPTLGTFQKGVKIVRTMPNTPAMVNEGMTAFCANSNVTESELAQVKSLLETFGKAEQVAESLIPAVVTVSGSSPAYVYLFIEALADGAVREGMSRADAYTFAAQAVYGSAKMVLDTKLHPGALKDMVCSPGGTTIEAVSALEAEGFRQAVLKAMKVCGEKARNM